MCSYWLWLTFGYTYGGPFRFICRHVRKWQYAVPTRSCDCVIFTAFARRKRYTCVGVHPDIRLAGASQPVKVSLSLRPSAPQPFSSPSKSVRGWRLRAYCTTVTTRVCRYVRFTVGTSHTMFTRYPRHLNLYFRKKKKQKKNVWNALNTYYLMFPQYHSSSLLIWVSARHRTSRVSIDNFFQLHYIILCAVLKRPQCSDNVS